MDIVKKLVLGSQGLNEMKHEITTIKVILTDALNGIEKKEILIDADDVYWKVETSYFSGGQPRLTCWLQENNGRTHTTILPERGEIKKEHVSTVHGTLQRLLRGLQKEVPQLLPRLQVYIDAVPMRYG